MTSLGSTSGRSTLIPRRAGRRGSRTGSPRGGPGAARRATLRGRPDPGEVRVEVEAVDTPGRVIGRRAARPGRARASSARSWSRGCRGHALERTAGRRAEDEQLVGQPVDRAERLDQLVPDDDELVVRRPGPRGGPPAPRDLLLPLRVDLGLDVHADLGRVHRRGAHAERRDPQLHVDLAGEGRGPADGGRGDAGPKEQVSLCAVTPAAHGRTGSPAARSRAGPGRSAAGGRRWSRRRHGPRAVGRRAEDQRGRVALLREPGQRARRRATVSRTSSIVSRRRGREERERGRLGLVGARVEPGLHLGVDLAIDGTGQPVGPRSRPPARAAGRLGQRADQRTCPGRWPWRSPNGLAPTTIVIADLVAARPCLLARRSSECCRPHRK